METLNKEQLLAEKKEIELVMSQTEKSLHICMLIDNVKVLETIKGLTQQRYDAINTLLKKYG